MTLIRKLIIISILFFLGCKIYAQNEKNLQPLKNILFSLEKKHNIYFNYLDSDIEKISILSPPQNLNLNKKIAYLEKKTDLFFEKISTNIFAIHSSKKKLKSVGMFFPIQKTPRFIMPSFYWKTEKKPILTVMAIMR